MAQKRQQLLSGLAGQKLLAHSPYLPVKNEIIFNNLILANTDARAHAKSGFDG